MASMEQNADGTFSVYEPNLASCRVSDPQFAMLLTTFLTSMRNYGVVTIDPYTPRPKLEPPWDDKIAEGCHGP